MFWTVYISNSSVSFTPFKQLYCYSSTTNSYCSQSSRRSNRIARKAEPLVKRLKYVLLFFVSKITYNIMYLRAGKGALVKHGQFWYPVRLLQRIGPFWLVRWWRHCNFAISPPTTDSKVPEGEILDELWQDQAGRRKIRVRRSFEVLNL